MAINHEQVKELLGSGLSPRVVADAVGCHESYISQLLGDEEFAADVTTRRTLALSAYKRRDASIDAIEDKLLVKLNEVIDSGAFYKPDALLRAFTVLNNAKRRGPAIQETHGTAAQTIINLTIPTAVMRNLTVSSTNEVIEADGRTLISKPAHALLKDLQLSAGAQDGEAYAKAAKFLPAAAVTKDTSG